MKITTFARALCAISLSLIITNTGCQASDKLTDGFYVQDETGKSALKIRIKDRKGKSHQFAVNASTNVTVKTILVYSLKPHEDAFQVQINLVSSDNNWSKRIPVLIVQGKPYFELSKSAPEAHSSDGFVKIPVTISFKVANESEAELIKERLTEKFKIQP